MTTPAPIPPLQIFRTETFTDHRGRLIIAKYEHGPDLVYPPVTFIGQGIAAVRGQPTPQNPSGITQEPFEIPLPGPSIEIAFAQFDAAQESAFRAHLEKMRLAAIRQGADLSQLPKANGR